MTNNPNEPDLRTTPQPYRMNARWPLWAGIIVAILVVGFGWSYMGRHPRTDQVTTSSTTTNSPTATAPAAEPNKPAPALAPPTAAPVTPAPAN
jgi:hypothetical protein